LKTPLASSDFSLKLLEDERVGELNAEQKELVQNIKKDNQRLLKILSELLDLSQLESGKIQLHITNVDARIPVKRALDSVTATAQQKRIDLQVDLASGLLPIKADEEKTTWVLINFLTNAIKYSAENAVILLQVKQIDNAVEFSVIDTGLGIQAEHISKLFNRFYKVPGSQEKGSGLGLSISKEFIEAMGGSIGVESKPGTGSRFYFHLLCN
jgi:signal transduction histidine kinase